MVSPVVTEMWLPAPASLPTMVTFCRPLSSILTVTVWVALMSGIPSRLVGLRFSAARTRAFGVAGRKGPVGRCGGSDSSGRGVADEPRGSEAEEGVPPAGRGRVHRALALEP